MVQITDRERKMIMERFPKASVTTTKNRCYLVTTGVDDVGRYLLSLRGEPQPPTRRQGQQANRPERIGDRFRNGVFSNDPRFRQNRP